MNELDRADIDTARRLRHQQQLRLNVILASDDQLLLIATGERPRRKCRVWWSNVECLDNLVGPALDRIVVEKNVAGERGDRWPIVHAEDGILREREIEQQATPVTVFRYVSYAQLAANTRSECVDVLARVDCFSRNACGIG